jgi:hypothetical protein
MTKQQARQYGKFVIGDRVDFLKNEIAKSDYKIVRCYEAQLLGQQSPYDVNQLTSERAAIRQEIRDLESVMPELKE